MTIDWMIVAAQIVNFLILVWLLKRFLYQPVLAAMARREERITNSLGEAHARERMAEDTRREFLEKTQKLELQRNNLVERVREEVELERRELLEVARLDVAASRADWQQQVEDDKAAFLNQLRQQSTGLIIDLLRKVLRDLANADLEKQIVDVFIEQLREGAEQLRSELPTSSETANLVSSFDVDAVTRERITRAVHDAIAEDIEIVFTKSTELVCGIELDVSGRRLSWNLASYCAELNARVAESLDSAASAI